MSLMHGTEGADFFGRSSRRKVTNIESSADSELQLSEKKRDSLSHSTAMERIPTRVDGRIPHQIRKVFIKQLQACSNMCFCTGGFGGGIFAFRFLSESCF